MNQDELLLNLEDNEWLFTGTDHDKATFLEAGIWLTFSLFYFSVSVLVFESGI